jgi:hydroxyethylthiazole kinase
LIDSATLLEKVREKKPLVHHITNWVTIYDCANVVRAIGALPVMAHAIEESSEMQGIANALVLNIGTLTPQLVESMIAAAKKANELQHPVVLDAVGAGATKLRTEKAKEILEKVRVDILKGNKSEIAKLAGADVLTRGVEASTVEGNIIELAKRLALERKNIVVVTGAQDIVASAAGKNFLVKNGHPLMGKFVGTGCMAASLIGCFAAVEADYAKASAAALSCFGIAGELAAKKAKAPAAFKQQLFDELYNLKPAVVKKMQKISELR